MRWTSPSKTSPKTLRLKDLRPGTAFAWSSTDPRRFMRCKAGFVNLATGGHIDFGTPKETK